MRAICETASLAHQVVTRWKTVTSPLVAPRFALWIGIASMCGLTGVGAASATSDFPQVRYEVNGSAGIAEYLTYQGVNGQQSAAKVKLPWSTEFTGFGAEVFVLSAQGHGTISCRILVDGKVVKEATATGTPGRTVCSK